MRTIRKYIILLFTGILGIITFSCSDFLDTTSGSQLTDNEIYQNEGDIYRAILNIYAQISEEKLYGRTIPLIYSFNTDIFMLFFGFFIRFDNIFFFYKSRNT